MRNPQVLVEVLVEQIEMPRITIVIKQDNSYYTEFLQKGRVGKTAYAGTLIFY